MRVCVHAAAGTVHGRRGLFSYHFTGAAQPSGPTGVIVFGAGLDELSGLYGRTDWSGDGATFSYTGGISP